MKLDGRILKIEQVREHLASLQFDGSFRPKFIEIHNTSVPDIKLFETWMARGNPTPSQWLKNLAGYYAGSVLVLWKCAILGKSPRIRPGQGHHRSGPSQGY